LSRVVLKLATSLDGRIATATGESRWITGEAARQETHRLRGASDAVIIGIETALADDPELTVRLPGYNGRQPARVVLDSRQRLTPTCKLVTTARESPTLVVTVDPPAQLLLDAGVQVITVPDAGDGRTDLKSTVAALAACGLSNLLVEGGGQVAGAFLRCDLVDEIVWFRAPIVLGGEGRPAIGALGVQALGDAPRFRRLDVSEVGDDLRERYERV
jgi:diaminohydroxyphosphoribosylaminopyrimidine deaminase/5-amino-6-(5-phosphoribosylamino)uracil reductase